MRDLAKTLTLSAAITALTYAPASWAGAKRVIYSFKGMEAGDRTGYDPTGPLTFLCSELYGTTYNGGTNRFGTVYALTP